MRLSCWLLHISDLWCMMYGDILCMMCMICCHVSVHRHWGSHYGSLNLLGERSNLFSKWLFTETVAAAETHTTWGHNAHAHDSNKHTCTYVYAYAHSIRHDRGCTLLMPVIMINTMQKLWKLVRAPTLFNRAFMSMEIGNTYVHLCAFTKSIVVVNVADVMRWDEPSVQPACKCCM